MSIETKAMFLSKEPEWICIDSNFQTDVDKSINSTSYGELKLFMFDYFQECGKLKEQSNEKSQWCSSIKNALTKHAPVKSSSKDQAQFMDTTYAIPGGRYGCA